MAQLTVVAACVEIPIGVRLGFGLEFKSLWFSVLGLELGVGVANIVSIMYGD